MAAKKGWTWVDHSVEWKAVRKESLMVALKVAWTVVTMESHSAEMMVAQKADSKGWTWAVQKAVAMVATLAVYSAVMWAVWSAVWRVALLEPAMVGCLVETSAAATADLLVGE